MRGVAVRGDVVALADWALSAPTARARSRLRGPRPSLDVTDEPVSFGRVAASVARRAFVTVENLGLAPAARARSPPSTRRRSPGPARGVLPRRRREPRAAGGFPAADEGPRVGALHLTTDGFEPSRRPPSRSLHACRVEPGDVAPDEAAQLTDGRAWRSADERGHPLLIAYFLTWCPVCGFELPYLEANVWARYRARARRGLSVVGVAPPVTVGPWTDTLDDARLRPPRGPHLSDGGVVLMSTYAEMILGRGDNNTPFPLLALVDREGRLDVPRRHARPAGTHPRHRGGAPSTLARRAAACLAALSCACAPVKAPPAAAATPCPVGSVSFGVVKGRLVDERGVGLADEAISLCGAACVGARTRSDGRFSVRAGLCFTTSARYPGGAVFAVDGGGYHADLAIDVNPERLPRQERVALGDLRVPSLFAAPSVPVPPRPRWGAAPRARRRVRAAHRAGEPRRGPSPPRARARRTRRARRPPALSGPRSVGGRGHVHAVGPSGARCTPRAAVTLPNHAGLVPGAAVEFVMVGEALVDDALPHGSMGAVHGPRLRRRAHL